MHICIYFSICAKWVWVCRNKCSGKKRRKKTDQARTKDKINIIHCEKNCFRLSLIFILFYWLWWHQIWKEPCSNTMLFSAIELAIPEIRSEFDFTLPSWRHYWKNIFFNCDIASFSTTRMIIDSTNQRKLPRNKLLR